MIRAPRALLDRIRALAVAAYPCECCGLLLGRPLGADDLVLTDIAPSRNVTRGSPRDSFEVDPALRLRLSRSLRGGAETIVGHYHSHPDRPATPSQRDAGAAWEPDLIWLIVAVTAAGSSELAAFRFEPPRNAFRPLTIDSAP